MKKLVTLLSLLFVCFAFPIGSNAQDISGDIETFVQKQIYILGEPWGPPIIYCFGRPKDCYTGEIEQ